MRPGQDSPVRTAHARATRASNVKCTPNTSAIRWRLLLPVVSTAAIAWRRRVSRPTKSASGGAGGRRCVIGDAVLVDRFATITTRSHVVHGTGNSSRKGPPMD